MLITDKEKLKLYKKRYWQGIPGVERTENGRLFVTFYSGGKGEGPGNFCVVLMSDDDGETWSGPVAAADAGEDKRCYDPTLWIDPQGKLWFIWSVMDGKTYGAYASVCAEPDAADLSFAAPKKIGEDVMLNKPIVAENGRWLFPIAVWKRGIDIPGMPESESEPRLAFVYASDDQGRTFQRLGGVDMPGRCYDEHILLESGDRLLMFVRTYGGIGVSESCDGGITWSEGRDTGWKGPCSRFFIRRLRSGRLLLVNHVNYTGRNNLTAMVSEDEGRTWKGGLLLDGRDFVTYPDGVEGDGYIYIVYDRERGYGIPDCSKQAREILLAKFTEEDILAGQIVSEKSYLKRIVSKMNADGDEVC